MAHDAQAEFFQRVKEQFRDNFRWCNVIEIGSLDINGSVRHLFEYANFVGFDLAHGPGVDYAVQGQDVQYPSNSFDTAISAECFEHNPYWAECFKNMHRMTKKDGLVTFTCAGEGRPEHGTARTDAGSSPFTTAAGWEYYENLTPKHFTDEFDLDKMFESYEFEENKQACDLYFWGVKK
jgi:SAM-dependent methyltransferase